MLTSAPNATAGLRMAVRLPLPGARFLAEAAEIAEQLRHHAVELPGGAVTWPAPPLANGQPTKLGPNVYDGVAGIALFLAALDHVRGGDDHREMVLRSLAPLRRTLAGLVADPARAERLRLGLGGLTGLGSFLYTLVRVAGWTGDDALLAEARATTLLLTSDRIASDERLDVVDGCAGSILALLALDEASPEANTAGLTPLEIATRCAARLLERRTSLDGRPRAWAGPGQPPLSGFAHGATGIGYALLRVFARTGDEALRGAALEGFAFERSLFDPVDGSWLDPRTGRPLEQRAWCHGAPGMALGRLGAPGAHGDAAARAELAMLADATRRLADVSLDHLCCGNLGRADILLAAHPALGDPALLDEARGIGARAVSRAEAAGGFALRRRGEPDGFRAPLFHGISGVGLALLRLAAPGTLPCILRLE